MYATATYKKISHNEVIINVDYPNGYGATERVTAPRGGSRYEAAYSAADAKARAHGYILNSFREETK